MSDWVSATFQCKNCGAPLDISTASGIVRCRYCNSRWTLPRRGTSSAVLDALRLGEHEIDMCRFDEAYSAYQKAAELDRQEPEAYFGMAQALFRVRYLRDDVDETRLHPICHLITKKRFTESEEFCRALSLADAEQRAVYLERGAEIDDIRNKFFEFQKRGLDYDVFISAKITDANGESTPDSHAAYKLYDYLKEQGLRPFYSEAEMAHSTGTDYEARILYALVKSPAMILVCFREEYLTTKWVKNEYMRFLELADGRQKESDALTIVFKGTPIERLPQRNGRVEGIDFTKPDAYPKVLNHVKRCCELARGRKESSHASRASAAREKAERRARTQNQKTKPAQAHVAKTSILERTSEYLKKHIAFTVAVHVILGLAELAVLLFLLSEPYAVRVVLGSPEEKICLVMTGILSAIILLHFAFDFLQFRGKSTVFIAVGLAAVGVLAAVCILIGWFTDNMHDWLWVYFAFSLLVGFGTMYSMADEWNYVERNRENGRENGVIVMAIKVLALIVAAVSVFGIVCARLYTVQAANDGYADGFYYDVKEDGSLAVYVREYDMRELDIPEELDGLPVTEFSAPVKRGGNVLEAVEIPDSLLRIGEDAFSGCTALRSVHIPDGVQEIGARAFEGCVRLAEVHLPASLEVIADSLFRNCTTLTSIAVPGGVVRIEPNAFSRCQRLTSFSLPEGSVWQTLGFFRYDTVFEWDSPQETIRDALVTGDTGRIYERSEP